VRKALVAVGAVVALIGIGAAAIPFAEDFAARRLKDGLAREGVRAETVKVSFLDRSISLNGVAGGPNSELTIGDWEASGLAWPLDEILKGRLPFAGLTWGDPLHVARLRLRNFRLAEPNEGGGWTIGELTATGVDLPRYDAVYEGRHRSEAMIARLLGALTVGRLEQTAVAHHTFDGTVYSAASVAFGGYAQGLMDTLEVKGFETRTANTRAATLTVAEISAAGVDLRRPIKTASSIDWEPGTPIGRVPVAKARLSGFGGELLGRYGVSLDSVASETTRESADLSRSRTTVEGFVLAPSLRSVEALGTMMVLQAMNLKEVRLGFVCDTVDDHARKQFRVEACALTAPGLADISLAASVVDADEEFWRAIDETDIFALLGTKAALASAKLVIADKSLLQRALQAKATFGGQTLAAERAALAAEIRRYQPPDVLITQDMSRLQDTIARFVEQGGTLTVEAKPQPTLGFEKLDYLLKPGADLVSALGLVATLTR
jgi:hypothetical protein